MNLTNHLTTSNCIEKIPLHVAIIMDGNRRWAKQKGVPVLYGHSKGANVATSIVKIAANIGVKVLTLYTFSTENWNRPANEVEELLRVISFFLRRKKKMMIRESVRLETIGDLSKFPLFLQQELDEVKRATARGSKISLVLALNYGSRDEMKRAIDRIVEDALEGKLHQKEISENLISAYLDTAKFSDPDLFIRTSGEQRLSNFLLWQMSYTEIYITDVLWPDFSEKDFMIAVKEFQKRERRFGGV